MTFIYTTCKNEKQASKLANHLFKKKLIACVNTFKVISTYPWKGKLVRENEIALLCKTTDNNIAKVKKEIKRIHPYEIPLIATIKSDVNKEYLKWMNSVVD